MGTNILAAAVAGFAGSCGAIYLALYLAGRGTVSKLLVAAIVKALPRLRKDAAALEALKALRDAIALPTPVSTHLTAEASEALLRKLRKSDHP